MTTQATPIKEPSDLIKELARVNDWHYGLLSRAMAVIGPSKSEDEVFRALQAAADNINLAGIRGGGPDHPDNVALKLKSAKVFGYRSVADFEEACKRPFPGYHHGAYPLASDAHSEPPSSCQPCDLKVGDIVTFTNDYGVAFHHRVVTGFAPQAEHGRFVYYDSDSWWFPVSPESLTLEHEADAAPLGPRSIHVEEATGKALAWMKAKAEGREVAADFNLNGDHMPGWWVSTKFSNAWMTLDEYQAASTRLLGSLISREGLAVRRSKGTWYAMRSDDLGDGERASWTKYTFKGAQRTGHMSYDLQSRQQRFEGPTLEEAATRCFVASKLGPQVDVPAELISADASLQAALQASATGLDGDEQTGDVCNAPAP